MVRLIALAILTLSVFALPAWAQPAKIFVASIGNDANDGSRSSPKRSFQAAHDAVASGGNIVVLDTAGYGALSIAKSVAVTVPPGVNGFVTVNGVNGITVNGSNAVVFLQGLIIEGSDRTTRTGIDIGNANTVTVEDCQIRGFNYAIDTISASDGLLLDVHRTSIRDVSNGIYVGPASTAMKAHVADTSVSNATNWAYSVTRLGQLFLTRSEAIRSGTGVRADQGGKAFVDASKISYNNLGFNVAGSAVIYSLNNNAVAFNTTYISGATDLTPISPR